MKLTSIIAFIPLFIWSVSYSSSTSNKAENIQQWILEINPSSSIEEVLADLKQRDIVMKNLKRITKNMDLYLIEYSGDLSEKKLITRVFDSKWVKNIGPNSSVYFRDTRPDDPLYDVNQTNLELIEAPRVWDTTTGGLTPNGDQIVVAVIDGAFQIDHPDLIDNIWMFSDEIDGDMIDNDGNGYIDDVHGWNSSEEMPITSVHSFHGTGVAGIVGARGNNGLGVSGINWDVKILPVAIRPINQGSPSIASVLGAYDYVLEQRRLYNETNGARGAYVVASNSSFGVSGSTEDINSAWCEFFNQMAEEGILSSSGAVNANVDVADDGDIPSLCTSDHLIVVHNTSIDDVFYSSGFSSTMVDLSAPGEGVFTLTDNSNYAVLGGTSSSSPHLAGAIGLLHSLPCPRLADLMMRDKIAYLSELKAALLSSVDVLPSLSGKNVTEGRLNIAKAMDILMQNCTIIAVEDVTYDLPKIYPNPVHKNLTVEYNNDDMLEACLSLSTASGKVIRQFTTDPIDIGVKEFRINDLGVPPGVYFLQFPCHKPKIIRSIVVR